MIRVNRRAKLSEDRAGDPLDGLVNLFDLGIVLSVGFLLAALSALGLSGTLQDESSAPADPDQITVPEDAEVSDVPDGQKVIGKGEQVGTVYRLDDGRLVYVVPPDSGGSGAPSGGTTPGPGDNPTP